MQILSYNPQDDEFFIGLSTNDFEYINENYIIDYGCNSSYEKEKENAEINYMRQEYIEFIKHTYRIKNVPFICIVADRYFSKIAVRPSHFPYGTLWNGYSPWQEIIPKEIETLNLQNIKISYIYFSDVLKSFCNEWIAKFSDEKTTSYHLIEDRAFPNYCISFGWNVDNGEHFKEHYCCDSYDEFLKYLPQVMDIDSLGSLIFAYWRYFNRWAYSSAEILDHKQWFVLTLTRLKQLADCTNKAV